MTRTASPVNPARFLTVNRAVSILILVGMASILVTDKLFGYSIAALLLVALFQLGQCRYHKLLAQDYLFLLLLCLYPLAVVANLSVHGGFSASEFDTPSRFLLLIPVYLWMRAHSANLHYYILGAMLACVFAAIYSVVALIISPELRVDGFDNAITYAQIAFLVTLIACIPPVAMADKPAAIRKLAVLGFIFLGLVSIVASQVRGVFILTPLLLSVFIWFAGKLPLSKLEIALLVGLTLAVCYFLLTGSYFAHLGVFFEELASIFNSDAPRRYDSSEHRLELWKAALDMINQNPWAGVGKGNFNQALGIIADQGNRMPQEILKYTHAHHELLNLAAEMGVFGVTAVLMLIVGAPWLGYRAGFCRESLFVVFTVSLSWLLFGLTQTLLAHQKVTLLIAVLLCVGFAHGMNNRYGVANRGPAQHS